MKKKLENLDYIIINYRLGCHKISSSTNLTLLEREIMNLVYMKCMYLGDKSSINSRFGTKTVNH